MQGNKINYLKLYDGSNVYIWLVDQLAVGHPYEIIKWGLKTNFNDEFSEYDLDSFEKKNQAEIVIRKAEIKKAIYDSGLYGKMQSTVTLLYDELQSGTLDAKEIATIAATLRGYMETLIKLGSNKEAKDTKIQNNFFVLQTLAKENIIEIKDPEKLQYLVDGERNNA